MDSLRFHRLVAESDWRRGFDALTLRRAEAYAREHRVLSLTHETLDPQTEALTGAVHGTREQPYLCAIELRAGRSNLAVRAQCSCPVGSRCKHAAALLIVVDRLAPENWPGASLPMSSRLDGSAKPARYRPADNEAITAWERWLAGLEAPPMQAITAETNRRFGILLRGGDAEPTSLLVNPVWLRPAKNRGGELVDPRPLRLDAAAGPQPAPSGGWPAQIAAALALLLQNQHVHKAGKYWTRIHAGYQERALETLLEHHPAYFEKGSCPLARGEPLALELYWRDQPDGSQRLAARVKGEADARLLLGANGWYVLTGARRYGRVEGDPRLLAALVAAPRLQPEDAATLSRSLGKRSRRIAIPPPTERGPVHVVEARPVPVLVLREVSLPLTLHRRTRNRFACARLDFDYAGHRLAPGSYETTTRVLDGKDVIDIRRNHGAENRALDRLEEAGLVDADLFAIEHRVRGHPMDEYEFLLRPRKRAAPLAPEESKPLLDKLEADGFRLEYESGFPHDELVEVEDWHAELRAAGNAWFEVALGIDVGGERVDLLPVLRRALADPAFPLVAAKDEKPDAVWRLNIDPERSVELPLARLRGLITPLLEWIAGEGELRVHASQAPLLDELAHDANLEWRGGKALRAKLDRLREAPRSAEAPPGFQATLRPYQREGLAWLNSLAAAGFGGILADDMGLGKTVQMLAHILGEKRRGRLRKPALVVAPTSLIGNWRAEAARFAPGLNVLVLHGADRAARYEAIAARDLVITTYPLLPRDRTRLAGEQFSLLVLDEAQAIKNARSQAARVVREIHAERRLAMTGTPLENHLGELWAQFDAVEPGLLGGERQFAKLYRNPIEKGGDAERRERLKRRIAPLLLRRRKDDVLTELPPKVEILRSLELAREQRELYETLRLAQHERVRQAIRDRGLAQSGIVVLDALLKLRQACCDPRLVKLESARRIRQSAKLDALLELLEGLLDEGRRILVFSQFTEMLGLIESALAARGIEYLVLTGQTPGGKRAELIERFQSGGAPVFLVSLKAGGVGLNLTAADAVIHYDPWWNPAVEAQATDRAHRIGQDKPVFVYKLLCAGTVEEKIHALQARKAELAQALLEGEGSGRLRFDEGDLAELFAPL